MSPRMAGHSSAHVAARVMHELMAAAACWCGCLLLLGFDGCSPCSSRPLVQLLAGGGLTGAPLHSGAADGSAQARHEQSSLRPGSLCQHPPSTERHLCPAKLPA